MPGQDRALSDWSSLELRLINTVDVFQHKSAIFKKAETRLTALKKVIIRELSQAPHPCPPDTDITKGQIVRGENHKGFPFISLDMPQMFSKTHMFTYRTLFWWGHYLISSLMLKQPDLSPVINNLVKLKEYPEWGNIQLSIASSPWEWENNTEYYCPVSETSEILIRKSIESVQYIKLCRFHSLDTTAFTELDWANDGLETWRILSKVCFD